MIIPFIMGREFIGFCIKNNYTAATVINRVFDSESYQKLTYSKILAIITGIHRWIAMWCALGIDKNHMCFAVLNLIRT